MPFRLPDAKRRDAVSLAVGIRTQLQQCFQAGDAIRLVVGQSDNGPSWQAGIKLYRARSFNIKYKLPGIKTQEQ